jgi:hypothetical protein
VRRRSGVMYAGRFFTIRRDILYQRAEAETREEKSNKAKAIYLSNSDRSYNMAEETNPRGIPKAPFIVSGIRAAAVCSYLIQQQGRRRILCRQTRRLHRRHPAQLPRRPRVRRLLFNSSPTLLRSTSTGPNGERSAGSIASWTRT